MTGTCEAGVWPAVSAPGRRRFGERRLCRECMDIKARRSRNFNALLGGHVCASAFLFAFDLLFVDGEDLRPLPLRDRTDRLAALQRAPDGQHGPAVFSAACRMGLEGIVSKRVESRYKSGACRSWPKVKNPTYEPR